MSSLKDLASLIMVPSLYKDGELHTVKPLADENIIVHPDATDNNDGVDGTTTPSTSGNFTFSRGSNLAATRVDVNGLIEKGRENLLLQSNQFDTTWSNNRSYETSGQSDPDGGSNAWWFREDANTGTHILQQNVTPSSGVYTGSIIAKAKERSGVQFLIEAPSSYGFANFDLTDGSVHSSGELGDVTLIDSNSEDLGGGWYRLRITIYSSVSLSWFKCYLLNSSFQTSYAGVNGNGIYLYQAQLEQGLVATDYIETGTSAAQSGILEDMPRLDYSGGASCPSLLLEPQRSNVMAQSEYFGGSYYVKGSGVSVVDNNYTSPEGLVNGAKLVGATGTDRNGSVIGRIVSVSSSTTYTASIYVYRDTATQCTLYLRDGSTGVILSKSVTLESGWQRIDKSLTTGASTSQMNLYLGNTDGDIGIYGFQVEVGSYPTSYIPTYGSSVTRSEDEAGTSAISGLVGANGGSLFIEISYPELNPSSRFSLSDGTYDNLIYSRTQTSGRIQFLGGDLLLQAPSGFASLNTFYKVAIGFEENNAVMYIDGVQIDTDTSFTMPSGLDFFCFGTTNASVNPLRADVKQVLIFPTRLTNAELAALTA